MMLKTIFNISRSVERLQLTTRRFNSLLTIKQSVNSVIIKNIHVSCVINVKKFPNREIEYISKFINNHESEFVSKQDELSNEKFSLEASYESKSLDELVKTFDLLSIHCAETETCLSDHSFDNFILHLIRESHHFDDSQIMKLLHFLTRFPQTPNVHTRNFYELWTTLDNLCCMRLRDWKQDQSLKVCNLWMNLHLSKVGSFTSKAITKICRRVDRLSAKDFVETMFYLTICRKDVQMIDVESKFFKIFEELNINEIGIVCLAYFKTETRMKTFELIDKIYEKLIREIQMGHEIHDITLVNILKTLRYSSDPSHAKKMDILSEALIPYVKKFSLIACLHVGLLGTNLQLFNQALIESIVERFNRDIKQARLKDIERLTFALGLFNFKSPGATEFLQKVVAELKLRVDEVVLYPKCLASTAHYLTVCGVYDAEIIASVLSKKFIDFAYGKNPFKIGREILCLDGFTQINLKDSYDGPQLTSRMRAVITKFQSHYVPIQGQAYRLTHADKLILDIKEFLEPRYGPNIIVHALPHFQRPDIVYCFDEEGKSVTDKVFDGFVHYRGKLISKQHLSEAHPTLGSNLNLVAVILGGWNFYLRDSNIPTGGLQMKVEQLNMIGYKTILVHFNEWLHMSPEEKKEFFHERMVDKKK